MLRVLQWHKHSLTNSVFVLMRLKVKDSEWKEIVKKQRKRRTVKVDSDLSGFIDE